MSLKNELKKSGVRVIAYWDENNLNTIMLTSVEKDYNYMRRGRGFRPASEHEMMMFDDGTRIYSKKVIN